MLKKECVDAVYNEKSKTLILYNEKAPKIEEREICR